MAPRETPFHNVGLAANAQMRELFGYWLPWEYDAGHVAEHRATRERVSLCDLDYMAQFKFTGADAMRFAQEVFTSDFTDVPVGRVRYTAMCNPDGNMIDDGTIWNLGTNEIMYISGDEGDLDWLSAQAERYDIELSNVTSGWTTLAVQGPSSREVMEKITAADLGSLRYFGFVRTRVAEVECILARMGYTGEAGFEVHFEPSEAETVWRAIMDAGAENDILPCGQAALESLRQEAGYLLVGNDHDKTTNPLEAGIGRVVKLSKDDFVGRAALRDIAAEGVQRMMVWFMLASKSVVRQGDQISIDGRNVGTVTSASYSPTLERGVAMGYVKPKHAIHGAEFDIGDAERLERATLSVMPLYDPGDVRTRQSLVRLAA